MGVRKGSLIDRVTDDFHLASEKAEVVDRSEAQTEDLASAKQMVDVGGCKPRAGCAITGRIQWFVEVAEATGNDIDSAIGCEEGTVAGDTGR
jgi:hypothetical protein